jgi:hypothetical protein
MHSHSRGSPRGMQARCPSAFKSREGWVPAAPLAPVREKARGRTAGEGGIIRPSLRQWFTAYFALWGVGLFAPTARVAHNATDLASASGGQDHTTSPSALMPIVFCINPSTASWTQHP